MSKHPGGRPPKYRAEYCDALVQHMTQGLSFESFAATIDVTRRILYAWAHKYPEFLPAKELGFEKGLLFWEKLGIAGAAGKVPHFNTGSYCFNMRNRFGWSNTTDITFTGQVTHTHTHEVAALTEELKRILLPPRGGR